MLTIGEIFSENVNIHCAFDYFVNHFTIVLASCAHASSSSFYSVPHHLSNIQIATITAAAFSSASYYASYSAYYSSAGQSNRGESNTIARHSPAYQSMEAPGGK